ncbi:MAG: hypothetical protein ACI857_000536 [Arenicella sp.]|jgi:hypothetical protein
MLGLIFADFDKIHFSLFGLDLLEPMALVTDSILGIISVYFGFKLKKMTSSAHPFYTYWMWFFFVFGVGAFYGGLAHIFFNYWGVVGKFGTWIAGPISIYCIEQAMIAAHPNRKTVKLLKGISFWKLVIVFAIWTAIVTMGPIHEKPAIGFLPIAINTIVGVVISAGLLGRYYYKKGLSLNYKYFVLGVVVMLPSAFIFLMKINLHPWFDKNDLSHVLLLAGIVYLYTGCRRLYKEGLNQDAYI